MSVIESLSSETIGDAWHLSSLSSKSALMKGEVMMILYSFKAFIRLLSRVVDHSILKNDKET